MSDETGEIPAGEALSYPTADSSPMSVEDAARSLTDARAKAFAKLNQPAESAPEATAEPELAVEANAAPQEEAHGEEQSEAEPEALPPIDPPSSWTKAEKERFQSLPRETQEYLHTREQERDRDFRRSQNEIAEQRKAFEAQREAAEKARQQYEAQLPALMQELQNAQQNTFADIKTVDDVTRLANEDPFRYLQWQAHQTKLQAVNAENERARTAKEQAEQAKWAEHVQKENTLAAEFIPELADKDKGFKLTQRVANELLPDLGFKDSELTALANGKDKLSIYDHRIQRLFADAIKLRDIQSATKAVAAKPVPAVQRPGQAKPANTTSLAQIQALEKQLSSATGDKAARLSAEIWRLEKKTASR